MKGMLQAIWVGLLGFVTICDSAEIYLNALFNPFVLDLALPNKHKDFAVLE
jgi:hypothetical protein